MFKLQPATTFYATASISVPGEVKPAKVEIEFKWMGKAQIKSYFESIEGKQDLDALSEIVVGWRGVDAEFTPENFATMLENYPQAALAIFEAFRVEALEAKTKN